MNQKLHREVIKYDIVDYCNLNCRNCGHFSQFKTSGERSIQQLETDITLLCNKITMNQFHIFGGEPLLHSNIIGVIVTLRKILGKDVEIRLLTNGLKINSMKDVFFRMVKHLNISIELTEYILPVDYEKIKKKITSYGIPMIVRVTKEFYNFMDISGTQNSEESFKLCSMCEHTYYEDGKIFLCAYVKSVPFVNEHFGYKIEHDCVSINDSIESIQKYLTNHCSTCRFCKSSRQPEKWRIND